KGDFSKEAAEKLLRGIDPAEISDRLRAAVARGELTEEQATAKWAELTASRQDQGRNEGLLGQFRSLGVSADAVGQYKQELLKAGVGERQIEAALGALLRVAYEFQGKEDDAMNEDVARYLSMDLGLTDAQINLVKDVARRAAASLPETGRR
ncbi:MAG: hypothetical protein AAF961_17565, partial [Planctomycetota bacterium]